MFSPDIARFDAPLPRHPHSRSAALALMLVSAIGSAHAQDALLDSAENKLQAKDAAGAYALLDVAEIQRAGDRRFDYLLGLAALDTGHATRAIFALERLTSAYPDDLLGHAELGRAYLAAGDPEHARAELDRARQGKLPADAALTIDRVIGIVDQLAPPSGPRYSGYLEVGGGHDSNVNSATNQGEFAVPSFGGILFTTSPDSRRHGDQFAAAGGGVEAQLFLGPSLKLTGAADLHLNANRVEHDMNTDVFDATLAATHTAGAHSQTVALQDGTAWVGSRLYRSANGASAQWQTQLDASSQGSVFAQWSHQTYGQQPDRNSNRTVAGVGYGKEFGGTSTLAYASAYVAKELASSAASAHFGHRATGARLGLEQSVSDACVGFFEWQHELRHYGGSEPFFDTARHDRQDDVSAGVRWRAGGQWQVTPQVRYTRSDSNVVLYDYQRIVLQITVHRSF